MKLSFFSMFDQSEVTELLSMDSSTGSGRYILIFCSSNYRIIAKFFVHDAASRYYSLGICIWNCRPNLDESAGAIK